MWRIFVRPILTAPFQTQLIGSQKLGRRRLQSQSTTLKIKLMGELSVPFPGIKKRREIQNEKKDVVLDAASLSAAKVEVV